MIIVLSWVQKSELATFLATLHACWVNRFSTIIWKLEPWVGLKEKCLCLCTTTNGMEYWSTKKELLRHIEDDLIYLIFFSFYVLRVEFHGGYILGRATKQMHPLAGIQQILRNLKYTYFYWKIKNYVFDNFFILISWPIFWEYWLVRLFFFFPDSFLSSERGMLYTTRASHYRSMISLINKILVLMFNDNMISWISNWQQNQCPLSCHGIFVNCNIRH